MSFDVMEADPIKRVTLALEDIRAGRMVILVDDAEPDSEGVLVLAADAVTPEVINFMAQHGRGLICLALTAERVSQLQLPMMAARGQGEYPSTFTVSIEARQGVTSGASAQDRARTIQVATDPTAQPSDLVTPGHVFPVRALDGGVLVRSGRAEGAVDLARLAGLSPAGVTCEIMSEDGSMARLGVLQEFGALHRIRIVTVGDLIGWRIRNEALVHPVLDAPLAVEGVGTFQSRVYRAHDGGLHLAVWMGELGGEAPVLTRIQAAVPVVDVFGEGGRLRPALRQIAAAGRGVLIYLHFSGSYASATALGLIRAHLQPASAGEGAGEDVLRELGVGSQILLGLGVQRLRLLINSPRKLLGLAGFGLEVVERVPLAPEA